MTSHDLCFCITEVIAILLLAVEVKGHGWMSIPPARNAVAGDKNGHLLGGMVGFTPGPTYPIMGNPYINFVYIYIYSEYLWVSYPQESLENTINTPRPNQLNTMVVHVRERGTPALVP